MLIYIMLYVKQYILILSYKWVGIFIDLREFLRNFQLKSTTIEYYQIYNDSLTFYQEAEKLWHKGF